MSRGVLVLALWVLLAGASGAHAQTYRWQDEQGRIHFTDDPSDVPPRFRTQVEQLELPGPTHAPGQAAAPQPAPSASDGWMAQAVDDAVRLQFPKLPTGKRQQVASAILDYLLPVLVGLAVHTLATLAMFGHAIANRRPLWAAGNLLVFFVPPLYALLALEADALKKGLIVVAWATGPAAAVALQWAIAGIVA